MLNCRKGSLVILGFLVLLLAGCQQKLEVHQIGGEEKAGLNTADFFRNPERTNYSISPDGKYFSYLGPYENRMNVFVESVDGDSTWLVTRETGRNIKSYFWVSKDRILYVHDTNGDENYKIFGVNINGENLVSLTDFEGVRTLWLDALEGNPNEILVALNKRSKRVFDPYRLNVWTGELHKLADNPGNVVRWRANRKGELLLAVAQQGAGQVLLYRETEDLPFQPVMEIDPEEVFKPFFFDFENKAIFAASSLGRDKTAIVKVDPRTGREIDVIFEHPKFDADAIEGSYKRQELKYATYTSWRPELHCLNPFDCEIISYLESSFAGQIIEINSSTSDERMFMIKVSGDRNPGEYYLFKKDNFSLRKVGEVAPWLEAADLCEMKPFWFKARDGLNIQAYLTMPNGGDTANLPMVVHPHGGPWNVRDQWEYDPEVQFLASQGYAVLTVNFRGSRGFGKAFSEAAYKQWGLAMQNDVTDAVYHVIESGVADPARIAIFGASYGGYTALSGLTQTPELYACAVDYVGVSNLFTFMNSLPPYWDNYKPVLYRKIGHPVEDSIQFVETSPALNAHKIIKPLFIAQGANDPRVNKAESDQMVKALEERGIEVEYMVKNDEGHGFKNEENRMEFYERMSAFLREHLTQDVRK